MIRPYRIWDRNVYLVHDCLLYLKNVFRWCGRDHLVVGNIDIHLIGRDFAGKRPKEGYVRLIVSHCPCSQRQSVGYILLVTGMDPAQKVKYNLI